MTGEEPVRGIDVGDWPEETDGVNAARKHQIVSSLAASGYEDAPALTLESTDGDMPQGREISVAWLSGAILTGLTSVMLMGAALYVSFKGQDTFSTPYAALQVAQPSAAAVAALPSTKTDRARPVAKTRSDLEIVEASIREEVDGGARIRRQPFLRIKATLATSATSLSSDIPAYDPIELLRRNQPIEGEEDFAIDDIYGAEVEGEVTVKLASLSFSQPPRASISDRRASEFVRQSLEYAYADGEAGAALAYAPGNDRLQEIGGAVTIGPDITGLSGVAENVTVVPKTTLGEAGGSGRTERILTIREETKLADILGRNGFTEQMVTAISRTLRNVFPSDVLTTSSHLRILFGPSRGSTTQIPYRVSIYDPDDAHIVTVALTDNGRYVIGTAPTAIEFTDEDTEEIAVGQLPSLYRSIFETGRKHDLEDKTIERIVSMYAYDLDLTKKVAPGDSIEILQSEPDAEGHKELLYVGLTVDKTKRELYRFQTEDGVTDFYDPEGQTGKKFLIRRPLEGGGRLRSRFGYRIHPIFKTRRLHSGIDLAARTGTPIYAGGDGVVKRAQWVSGYGRYVELTHANGYGTAYAHMSRIADGMRPGTRVRQGQVIGYVGSTGNSTGPHLHYEIKINGRPVDALSVRLPRDKTLPNRYASQFEQRISQVRDLMQREDAQPFVIASAD